MGGHHAQRPRSGKEHAPVKDEWQKEWPVTSDLRVAREEEATLSR